METAWKGNAEVNKAEGEEKGDGDVDNDERGW